MNLKALLVIPIFILSLGTITVAQNISAGIFTGVSNYQGDIVKYQIIPRESNFAYGGFFRYTLSRKFSIKSNVYFGK
jgi:hypothetical protein